MIFFSKRKNNTLYQQTVIIQTNLRNFATSESKFKLMRRFIFILISFLCFQSVAAQRKYEVRATWITTIFGLDWPKTKATNAITTAKQKEEIIQILDQMKAANINTILFQTRTRGEVFYRSNIEPMSETLTGKLGGDPGYDPLAFVIKECHKRGMECHAWMVMIPIGLRNHFNALGKQFSKLQIRGLYVNYKNCYYLNPGNPGTGLYLKKLVHEVVENYDVDGVNFDYLRYPEYSQRTFPDRLEYKLNGDGRSLDEWRRDNITEILRGIYHDVKAIKPWVKVSSSPVGKYKNTSRYSSSGWNAYFAVYQDPEGWLGEGIEDQLYPMQYFKNNYFYPFMLDWQEASNGRQIIPGLGIYFLDPKEGNWTINDIKRQIQFCRESGVAGEAYYRSKYLMDNSKGIYDELQKKYYRYPTLIPPMPWLDSEIPSAPAKFKIDSITNGYVRLSWQMSKDNDRSNNPMYIIYASNKYPVNTNDPKNIIATYVRNTTYTYAPLYPWESKTHFAITAIDRYGNESLATQIDTITIKQQPKQDKGNQALLPE